MSAVHSLFTRSRKVAGRPAVHLVIAAGMSLAGSLGCRRADETRPIPPSIVYESHLRAGGSNPPAGELVNPLTRNPQEVKDGEQLFSSMNCDGCHGTGGLGWVGPSL